LPEQLGEIQITLMKQWLRLCDENHKHQPLGAMEIESRLPTRVIDVGNDAVSLTLCLSDGNDRAGKYIALSHCWGNEQGKRLCTYRHNIQEHKQHIDFDRLPKTFQDAVRITRALNIQFLWIDSICIIQDDEEYWRTESGCMGDVFSAAYCTLAASSGTSSAAGFLGSRKTRQCVTIRTRSAGTIYVCEAIDDFHRDVEEGALNKRGWVLQERALSRRLIHFTATQVYWECGAGIRCETLATLYK
jgi:hypothetical protein